MSHNPTSKGFDPYSAWFAIAPGPRPPEPEELLGLALGETNLDRILESNLGDHAWYEDNSGGRTHPVGQKKPNAWGLYDMHGNVLEWCADWYGAESYAVRCPDDPLGPDTGTSRVLRGGSWDDSAFSARCAVRGWGTPNKRYNLVGFRVARTQ